MLQVGVSHSRAASGMNTSDTIRQERGECVDAEGTTLLKLGSYLL